MSNLRFQLYRQFDPMAWDGDGLSLVNKCVMAAVILSVLMVVLESEPTIKNYAPDTFFALKLLFAVAFTLEYIARFWVMKEAHRYAGPHGRWRFFRTPMSLLDVSATALVWIEILSPLPGTFGVLLRLARILRIFALMRNSNWAEAFRLMGKAIKSRYVELVLSLCIASLALLVSATFLFAIEGSTQPEVFGSIPRSMWWAVATLTTVGYGDVYPITALGKVVAGLSALMAIAVVGMPAGIMAAAFSDAFQRFQK